MKKLLFILPVLLILFNIFLNAQDTVYKPGAGLAAVLQGTQLDIAVPIFVTDKFQIMPSLGFTHLEDVGGSLLLGIEFKHFFNEKLLRPYISLRGGASVNMPENADTDIDIIFGPGFGGEYFMSENLSFGVEIQLNFVKTAEKSSNFGNTGKLNINTATAAFMCVYF